MNHVHVCPAPTYSSETTVKNILWAFVSYTEISITFFGFSNFGHAWVTVSQLSINSCTLASQAPQLKFAIEVRKKQHQRCNPPWQIDGVRERGHPWFPCACGHRARMLTLLPLDCIFFSSQCTTSRHTWHWSPGAALPQAPPLRHHRRHGFMEKWFSAVLQLAWCHLQQETHISCGLPGSRFS
jgi:hypothetical protein